MSNIRHWLVSACQNCGLPFSPYEDCPEDRDPGPLYWLLRLREFEAEHRVRVGLLGDPVVAVRGTGGNETEDAWSGA